ncbi:class I SAM-dependent methyltransferase [Octadecabacter ascidiaceicola]|uniref:Methyltransferase type 12 domain-containing protein n=1 Tax=Octadecabacter ascidiaceicola TaxID=1655543 RepID=A0A238JSX6_9RHOB|nr:class I SAM-dependent methyltransferase [Octadecabacter ascidiaceicola]SMX33284.1 hypothetical protein OCA8868_00922 [Octadecabacter ascidiaceicola]
MSDVQTQYETYPYPERDPSDEAKRLITGSPSDPREIDHYLFGGHRDWSKPLCAMFAGGGTGDGLIQLAQMMKSAGRPYEITYIDLSKASREIAEARATARGLTGITFHTGSLLDAAEFGPFDYIDCCGVLHHLPDPAAGLAALRTALAPGGGLGFMVYAPLGRSGVYPLQAAFGAVLAGLPPRDRLAQAKKIFERLPEGHPFKINPHVVDHNTTDAGFYDLLLHTQDQAFDVASLLSVFDDTGWQLQSFCEPMRYDLTRFCTPPEGMGAAAQLAAAEQFDGTIKTHVGYARLKSAGPLKRDMACIPHLRGAPAAKIAKAVAQGQSLPITRAGQTVHISLPAAAAPLIAGCNGRRSLNEIAQATKTDPIAFNTLWAPVEAALTGWGMLLYSDVLKGQ